MVESLTMRGLAAVDAGVPDLAADLPAGYRSA